MRQHPPVLAATQQIVVVAETVESLPVIHMMAEKLRLLT